MTTFEHPPIILFLYGSLRERSYSRLVAAARIIQDFGVETRFFDPCELPIYGIVEASHRKVQEFKLSSNRSKLNINSTSGKLIQVNTTQD